MPSSRARDPVILIGAPRSGTSLLTRMLEGLGLFVGRGLNAMHEARFFQILNHWVIFQSGGSWDHPQPVRRLLEHAEVRGLTTNYLRFLLQTPRIASYLGWWNYLRFRSLFNVTVDWGWKDAHTTLTLPVWMDLFPQARVVHIVRHGVDVAASLRTYGRAAPGERWAKKLYYRLKPLHWIRPKRGLFVYSLRCDSLEGGFGLWEEYVAEATSADWARKGWKCNTRNCWLTRNPFSPRWPAFASCRRTSERSPG
jgi:hypothetical protein